jgi:hypothetical protein
MDVLAFKSSNQIINLQIYPNPQNSNFNSQPNFQPRPYIDLYISQYSMQEDYQSPLVIWGYSRNPIGFVLFCIYLFDANNILKTLYQ